MSKKSILGFICGLLVFGCVHWALAQDAAPVTSAQKWFEIMDQGQYAQTWETASAYFKSMISKEQWIEKVMPVRKSLGAVVSRTLKDSQHFTALPGVPDGDYYVLSFKSAFVNKASAVETVTMMKEANGQWGLAGYFIK